MAQNNKGYPNPGKVIRGTLYEKYFKCKDRKCSCHRGEKIHGPHNYLSYSTETYSRNIYISPEHIKTAREYVNNYNKLWDFIKKQSLKNIKRLKNV